MKKLSLIAILLLSSTGLFAQEASAAAIINNMIPLVAIIFTMAVPILIVLTIFYYRHKDHKARMTVAQAAVEAGQPVPEDLFKAIDKPKKQKNNLQQGIEFIGIGVGMSIMLYFITEPRFAAIGIMPFCMGIGYLVTHSLEKKQAKNNNQDESTAA